MDIQELIQTGTKAQLPIEQLRALASNPAAFGADIIDVFAGQAERRAVAAGDVLKTAETEQRDLLASEQRNYNKTMLEAEQVRSLQRDVEARTAAKGYVPASQTVRTETRTTEDISPVLNAEQRMSKWLESRGGYRYAGETGRLSFGRIVRALATGNRDGMSDLELRALAEGSGPSGGYTVPEIVATRFIDRVRDALVVQRAGAQIVPMSSDIVHMAKLAQPGVVVLEGSPPAPGSPAMNALVGAWKLENDPIVEADLILERVTLNAKTLPILVRMSVELSEDSTNIDNIIETELSASMARELDRVALVGSGTDPEPRGILNTSDVQTGSLAIGSPGDESYDFLIDAVGQLWTSNFEPNAEIHDTATAIALAKMKGTVSGETLARPAVLDGVRSFRTNAAAGYLFVGDFSQLLIGMRTSFRLETTRVGAGAFENLQIVVRAYLRADVAVAHPEAFVVLS